MIYAKSDPEESLRQHTKKLIDNYEILKNSYECKLEDKKMWELLFTAVKYHDAGKIYSQFQNKIIENIGNKQKKDIKFVPKTVDYDIPHNYLSPAFLPFMNLGYNMDELRVLVQSIAYHHERDKEPDTKIINEIIEKDLKSKVEAIKKELDIEVSENLMSVYTTWIKAQNRIKTSDKDYKLYVLVKGLLHRLDHSASAHEKIEIDVDKNVAEYTQNYMKNKNFDLREVQKFSKENKDKNVIVIASTGMGKTESALFWIDNDKSFFTLPLRVSINALFDRVSEKDDIGYEYAGLLHSTSIDHLDESGYEKWEEIYAHSKILCSKLTFTTIDQVFKFPFKYKGYEKMYATMAYSKVVIDEIQAYSPDIAAVLLKGLEMIHEVGGKFMIMTATLPKIYTQYLEKRGIIKEKDIVRGQFLNEVIRHKINVKEKPIINDIEEIVKRGYQKKVIVIVNTVDRAIKLFNEICNINGGENTFLLHSLFIEKHRSVLEKNIKDFADDKENKVNKGIWVTTQIVEASLDVDFDYLFTELSTLDSLFQRLGRCYRKRPFDLKEPNVYIYTEDIKGVGAIYDRDVWQDSKEMIMKYDMQELKEEDKVNMVEQLYSEENLKGTEFLDEFKNALKFLDTIEEYELSSKEAQKVLRNIENINAIPREIFNSIDDLLERYDSETEKDARKALRREISKYTVSIPLYKARVKGCMSPINIKGLDNIMILERVYEFNEEDLNGKGVLVDEELSNLW